MGGGKERDSQDSQPFIGSKMPLDEDFKSENSGQCGNCGNSGGSGNSQCSSGHSRGAIEQIEEITGQIENS